MEKEKTILVDVWNCFLTEDGVNKDMHEMLEEFPNKKILLTNADDDDKKRFNMFNMPYELFTMEHNPDKVDPVYYEKMFEHFGLKAEDVVYFEHNSDAVKSAESLGIDTLHYDKGKKDLQEIKSFLVENL